MNTSFLIKIFYFHIKITLILFLFICSSVSNHQQKFKFNWSKYDSNYQMVAETLYESTQHLEGSYSSLAQKKAARKMFELFHTKIVKQFMDLRKIWDTSNLGNILFLFEDKEYFVRYKNKRFSILIWKFMDFLENRHLKYFGDTIQDPLKHCSVRNCDFTGDDTALSTADAVVVHIQHGLIPEVHKRPQSQRWVFLTDESPRNTFSLSNKRRDWKKLAGQFNWSMTYRTESDIPVPYGRVVPLASKPVVKSLTELIPNWKKKRIDVLVTVLASNCLKKRMEYINELSKYVQVDVYGQCSKKYKNSCPGHFRAECKHIETYLFYLSFENAKCEQYLTEKVYHNAISKGAVPIIMGSSTYDCDRLLPPGSYLHVDNYGSPKELADHIINLSKNIRKYLAYHKWRLHFKVLNEHGYFKTPSKHFCRICEALNYNSESQKTYNLGSLALFLDPQISCT